MIQSLNGRKLELGDMALKGMGFRPASPERGAAPRTEKKGGKKIGRHLWLGGGSGEGKTLESKKGKHNKHDREKSSELAKLDPSTLTSPGLHREGRWKGGEK